ncbi:hypothetical protein N752_17715 [Desulforamulus aquiferis]|nr:hypothetical protein N752_17715 [Desulforamulus aquiferis]
MQHVRSKDNKTKIQVDTLKYRRKQGEGAGINTGTLYFSRYKDVPPWYYLHCRIYGVEATMIPPRGDYSGLIFF